jgi:hypothetical protein
VKIACRWIFRAWIPLGDEDHLAFVVADRCFDGGTGGVTAY